MRELLQKLNDLAGQGSPVVLCRLVETRGSTPQKAGATMLVYGNGEQFGTLGGGCVEAEVKRRADSVLQEGPPKILKFDLDRDYGWDDGLICGGRMLVLVEPLLGKERPDWAYFETLQSLVGQGLGCTEAIAFDEEKSGIAVPSSYLFDADGRLAAKSAGADTGEATLTRVREGLIMLEERPRPYTNVGISYLPILPRCRLLIVGGGHVGQAVGNMAAELDFDVWVVDDRSDYVAAERFPRAERRISGDIKLLRDLDVDSNTYCLIVTRGHNHDEEALSYLVDRGARYVGMIGSRRKIRMIFTDLEEQGVSRETLSQVFAPVGIDIGSQTVPEIAVSILAELVAHRNCNGSVPGRMPPVLTASDSVEP